MTSTQCIECKHYRLDLKCAAFPVRIPEEILTGKFNHDNPYPGDKGIRFEPFNGKDPDDKSKSV